MLYGKQRFESWRNCGNVLILIFLENALRQSLMMAIAIIVTLGLNPYFFGKCSTAPIEVQVLYNNITS